MHYNSALQRLAVRYWIGVFEQPCYRVSKPGVYFLTSKQLVMRLPLVDPSLCVSRFTNMQDVGENSQVVFNRDLPLIARIDRDWVRTDLQSSRYLPGISHGCCTNAPKLTFAERDDPCSRDDTAESVRFVSYRLALLSL